jgi:hypothetical protein
MTYCFFEASKRDGPIYESPHLSTKPRKGFAVNKGAIESSERGMFFDGGLDNSTKFSKGLHLKA